MKRMLLILSAVGAVYILTGCTAGGKTTAARETSLEGLPGITAYYEKATAPHRRAVRKPIRDARARALRHLAEKTEAMIAEAEAWDNEAQLVSLAEAERPAARAAVANFRTALEGLHSAAVQADIAAVRQEYARAMASYRHVNKTLPATD